jgi:GntR family transcriptional regulator
MHRTLRIDPTDPRPIWRQIEEGVRHLVANGSLPAGAAAPSVRDLAKELQVNPATVSKAYQRLMDAGVLTVKRGEGTFVSSSPPVLTNGRRTELLQEGALRYASLARVLGASRDQALQAFDTAWDALVAGLLTEPSEEEPE